MQRQIARITPLVMLLTLVLVVTLTIPSVAVSPTAAHQAQAVAQAAQVTQNVQQSSPTVDPKCLDLIPAAETLAAWEPAAADAPASPAISPAMTTDERQAMHNRRFPASQREAMRQHLEARKQATKIQQLKMQATPPPEFLEPGVIYGRVLLPDGSPAVEAYVWVYPLDDEGFPIEDAVNIYLTDSDGIFGVDMLDVGDYTLKIEPPTTSSGLLILEGIAASIGYPEAWVDVGDLTLQQAAKTIQGTVYRADGTTPVAEATVSGFNQDTWQFITTKTDANGAYTLYVGGGVWEVMVEPGEGVDWVFANQSQLVTFAEDESQETATVNLTVQTTDGTLTGRVLDPQGNPITYTNPDDPEPIENPYASIDVWNTANGNYSYSFLDPDTGTFRLPLVAGVYEVQLWIDPYYAAYMTYSIPSLDTVEISKDDVSLGDLTLIEQNSTLKGTVTDADGIGIAGAWVDVWQEEGAWDYTETDATGNYTITIAAGEWLVEPSVAEDMDYLYTNGVQEVRVTPSGTETIDFTLDPIAGTIRGTVVDTQGNRLTDIDAWAYARPVDSLEEVSVNVVASGRFALKVPAGEMRVGLYLAPGSDYSFTDEGIPAVSAGGDQSGAELAMREREPYEQVVMVSPQADSSVTITLKPNDATITGKLVDKQGNPITGIQGEVFVSPAGTSHTWQWKSINPGDGSFSISVSSGDWLLSYDLYTEEYIPYPPENIEVTAISNQATTQDLTLTRLDGEISGQVVDEEGNPKASTYVWVGNDDYSDYVLTDEQGQFMAYVPMEEETSPISTTLAADLQARRFSLRTAVKNCKQRYSGTSRVRCIRDAIKQMRRPRIRNVMQSGEDAALNQTVDVVLVVRESNAYVVGQVFDANNTPVTGAFVDAYSSDDQNGNTTTDTNGCFLLDVAHTTDTQADWWLSARYYDVPSAAWWESDQVKLSTTAMEEVTLAGLPGATLARTSRLQAPLVLKSIANKLQAPEMHKFKVASGWSYTLPDGTRIQIPANAVPTAEEWVQIAIAPTVYLPDTGIYRKVGNGYTITLYEARSGKKISKNLKTDAQMSFSYANVSQATLAALDDEVAFHPAQYAADTWQLNQSFTINPSTKRIMVQTRRFGVWGLVQKQAELAVEPQVEQVFLPIVQRYLEQG